MSSNKIKILKNAFLSTIDNKLKLADVKFFDHIGQITERTSRDLDWKETNASEKCNKLVQNLGDSNYRSDAQVYDRQYRTRNRLWPICRSREVIIVSLSYYEGNK